MKVTRLTVENFMRITGADVVIDPDKPGTLTISGGNEQGKSSFLDAFQALVQSARSGTKRTMPVHKGASQAVIVGEFTDDDGVVITVTRTYNADGGTNITVKQDGLRVASPATIMGRLWSHVAFDPLAFANSGSKEQTDTLVRLTGFDPAPLDEQSANVYATRRDVNREVDRLAAQVQAYGPEDKSLADAVRIDPAATARELADVVKRNQDRLDASRELVEFEESIRVAEARVAALRKAHADTEAELAGYGDPEDPAPLELALQTAQAKNDAIARRDERARVVAAHAVEVAESKRLTAALDAIAENKRAGFAAASMPVPGLTIEDGEVFLNGTPFAQASAGAKVRTSVAIAMAANPGLRAIIVRDGSLLDPTNRKVIDELAAANDFTVLMEVVGEDASTGVVFEDGVASQRTEAVSA